MLACLEAASAALTAGQNESHQDATAEEFYAYWAGESLLVDCPDLRLGRGVAEIREIKLAAGPRYVLVNSDKGRLYKDKIGPRLFEVTTLVVETKRAAVAIPGDWPPHSLRQLREWYETTDSALISSLQSALRSAFEHRRPALLWIKTPLNDYALLIATEKLKHLNHNPQSAARRAMRGGQLGGKVTLERYSPVRIEARHLADRNLHSSQPSLADLRVTVIGCGAVGSFLSANLARIGAGAGRGQLQLIDPGELTPGNIGRHLLGFDYLFENKAKACARHVQDQLPGLQIEYQLCRAETVFNVYRQDDIIFDTTGHDGFSLWLNERRLEGVCGPVIYSWVYGNGVAAAAYLHHDQSQACFACLRTSEYGHGLSPLKAGYSPDFSIGASCDSLYVPFSVSSVGHATAIATQLALDWRNERPNPTFRVMLVDSHQDGTRHIKSKTPSAWQDCHACA